MSKMNTKTKRFADVANTTIKEISFLDGIVSGAWVSENTPVRTRNALQGYINSAMKRVWDDGVDAKVVRSYAVSLLSK